MKKVIIFGTLDTAELAHYYLTNDSKYEIEAFTANEIYISSPFFKPRGSEKEYPVVPFEKIKEIYPPEDFFLFAPMTGVKMNTLRKMIYEEGKNMGYDFITYVSSKATVFDNEIGENCFILEDNTLQPFTTIGNNVVLWSGNHIGHHGIIEDHVFFTSHIVMSGHCHIKQRAWIGVNSTIRDFTTIGNGCLIGMGSLVTKDTSDGGFYLGSPARIQEKSAIDIY